MENYVVLKMTAGFFAGGGMVVLTTWLAEKLGSKIGGVIAGFPTTIFMSLLLMGVLLDAEFVQKASLSTLVSLSLFGFFCAAYIALAGQGKVMAIISASVSWLIASALLANLNINDFLVALVLFAIVAAPSSFLIYKLNTFKRSEALVIERPRWGYALRFMMGGGVMLAVGLASLYAGESWGGVLAAFPSIAISSIIVLQSVLGRETTTRFVKNQFLGAMVNCSVYILAVYFLYPVLGVVGGTLCALIFPLVTAYLLVKLKQ